LLPNGEFTGELQRVRVERLVSDIIKFSLIYYQMKLLNLESLLSKLAGDLKSAP